jgi:hypothetical protein
MWQHGNTWQHDESNPGNCCQHLELDHQIKQAFHQGTVLVLREHQHLIFMPLADQQQLSLLDKVAWLEFVQLAQWQARAHLQCQQETCQRFRAWAKLGLPDPHFTPIPAGSKKPKRAHSRST